MKILTDWILPLLIYSGPLLPAIGGWTLRNRTGQYPYRAFFAAAAALHCLAFMPFIIGSMMRLSDILHALLFPALTGFLSLFVGIILILIATIRSKHNRK